MAQKLVCDAGDELRELVAEDGLKLSVGSQNLN